MDDLAYFKPLPLYQRWQSLFGMREASERLFVTVEEMYAEPHRHYHTLDHIEDGLNVLDKLKASPEVKVAFWFHDVIYDAGAKDNEVNSANWAYVALFPAVLGWTEERKHEMERLVWLTKDHKVDWWDKNGCDMVVADLHGLGADLETYQKNGANVRQEYAAFSDEEWKIGRNKFLTEMVMRRKFPPQPEFELLEKRADRNLNAEWNGLKYAV